MPMRGEVWPQPLGKGGRLPAAVDWGSTSTPACNPDFLAVCGFSLIGLFTSLMLAMQFPVSNEMTTALLAQF
jgi:hypothetical protein